VKKQLLLALCASALLMLSLVCSAQALVFHKSWVYGAFNNTTYAFTMFEETLTSGSICITSHLVLNETANPQATVQVNCSSQNQAFVFVYYQNGALGVAFQEGSTVSSLVTSTWLINETIELNFDGNYVTIINNDVVLIGDFSYDGNITCVGVKGSSALQDYVATAGYLSIDSGGGFGDISGTMNEIIPLIIDLAVIGCVIGAVKKIGI